MNEYCRHCPLTQCDFTSPGIFGANFRKGSQCNQDYLHKATFLVARRSAGGRYDFDLTFMTDFAKIIGSDSKAFCTFFDIQGCGLSENFRKVKMLNPSISFTSLLSQERVIGKKGWAFFV